MAEPYDPNPSSWARDDQGYHGPPPSAPLQGWPNSSASPHPRQPPLTHPYPASGSAIPPLPGAGYPLPYGPPVPMYSIYPDPGAVGRDRPGQVVATAVLGYVEAGLLILTGLILFSGSSASSSGDYGWGAQFAFAGVGDMVAAGLLIAGGVAFVGGRRLGRTLVAAGLGLCVLEALFWVIRLSDSSGAIFAGAAFYLTMPIIGTSLSFAGRVSRWLDTRG